MVDTLIGYAKAQAAKAAGDKIKELDWDGLKKFVEEHKDKIACIFAGLEEDWEWTGDEVYTAEYGWLDNNGAYTSSLWATPIAYIHYKDGYEEVLEEFKDFVYEDKR